MERQDVVLLGACRSGTLRVWCVKALREDEIQPEHGGALGPMARGV